MKTHNFLFDWLYWPLSYKAVILWLRCNWNFMYLFCLSCKTCCFLCWCNIMVRKTNLKTYGVFVEQTMVSYYLNRFTSMQYKRNNIVYLTLIWDKVFIFPKSTQWAAVRTQFGATRLPPQKCWPRVCNDTIQGYSWTSDSVPSTI